MRTTYFYGTMQSTARVMAAHSTLPKISEEKHDDQVSVNPLSKNSRSSDPTPSSAENQDTGYGSGATESQTAESLAEVRIMHQQCSRSTLPNPITDWAM